MTNSVLALTLVGLVTTYHSSVQLAPAGVRSRTYHPMTVMHYCVARAIACGLELKESDILHGSEIVPVALSPSAHTTATEVVAIFNENNATYRASMTEGVVVIRPAHGTAAYLDSAPGLTKIEGRGLMWLVGNAFIPLDPSFAGRSGLGSELGPADGTRPDTGEDIYMEIDGSGRSVVSILNEIVRKAPTHAWLVTTDGAPVPTMLRLGIINPGHHSSERRILY